MHPSYSRLTPPPALTVDCYLFDGVGARRPPRLHFGSRLAGSGLAGDRPDDGGCRRGRLRRLVQRQVQRGVPPHTDPRVEGHGHGDPGLFQLRGRRGETARAARSLLLAQGMGGVRLLPARAVLDPRARARLY